MRLKNQGFSLIEILVVIVILAILLSVAVPGYQSFVQNTRRADAQNLVLLNAQRLQRCFTLGGAYDQGCSTRDTSEEGYYSLTSFITPITFTITATPVAGSVQADDAQCRSFSYDHTGLKTATGTNPDRCWD